MAGPQKDYCVVVMRVVGHKTLGFQSWKRSPVPKEQRIRGLEGTVVGSKSGYLVITLYGPKLGGGESGHQVYFLFGLYKIKLCCMALK